MSEDESSSEEQEETEVLSDQEDHDKEPDPASLATPLSDTEDEDKPAAQVLAAGAESTDVEGGAKEDDAVGDKGDGQEEGEQSGASDGSKAEPIHDVCCTIQLTHT